MAQIHDDLNEMMYQVSQQLIQMCAVSILMVPLEIKANMTVVTAKGITAKTNAYTEVLFKFKDLVELNEENSKRTFFFQFKLKKKLKQEAIKLKCRLVDLGEEVGKARMLAYKHLDEIEQAVNS